MWPGEKGFKLLEADGTFPALGMATGCHYRFVAGARQYVDVRDLPGLEKETFAGGER